MNMVLEMAELVSVVASSEQEAAAANDPPPTADHIPPLNGPATAGHEPPPSTDHHIPLPDGPVGADESFHLADDTQPPHMRSPAALSLHPLRSAASPPLHRLRSPAAPSLHPLSKEAEDQELLKRAFKVALLICAISAAVVTNSPGTERKPKGLSYAYFISALISFIIAYLMLVICLMSWELHISTSMVRFLMWVALGLFPVFIILGAFLVMHN
ncbi:hypothetical protein AAC387_Pa06g1594 [Persea americana]